MSVTNSPPESPGGARFMRKDPPEEATVRAPVGGDIVRVVLGAAGVFLGALALGVFTFNELTNRGSGYFIIAAAVAIVLSVVAYYRFEFCLAVTVAAIWVNIGSTPDLTTGTTSGAGRGLYLVDLACGFLLFIWALRAIGGKAARVRKTPIDVPLMLYLAFSVLTAVNGCLFWDPIITHFYAGAPNDGRTPIPVVVLDILLRLVSIGMYYLVANNLDDRWWLRRISWALMFPGLAVLVSYLYHAPPEGQTWGVLLETVVACSLWGWLLEGRKTGPPENRKWTVPAAILLCALMLHAFLINIHWISGWLTLFTGLFTVTFVRSKPLFVALAVLFVLLALGARPFLKTAVVEKVQQSGDMDRFSMARGAVLYALHYPLGIGPGNYRAYNQYYGSPQGWNTTPYTSCHDTYGQTLSEMGFGGLALLLFWVISAFVMLRRIYNGLAQGFSRSIVLGIMGMWAGLSVASFLGDYFIPVYYNGGLFTLSTTIYGWIALGIAVAHGRNPIVNPKEPAATTEMPNAYSRASGRSSR